MSDIYGDHASTYLQRGWNSPLPLPEGMKYPPPDDTTGNKPYPDINRVYTWCDEIPESNLGLRMPQFTVDGMLYELLGIDVDDYDEKHGGETLTDLVEQLGPLPRTYRSTSRDPENPSGIRFFRVPANAKWRGKPGPDIEIIQRTHRYAVAWPSETDGRTYQWYDANDQPLDEPPHVAEFPDLPEPWVDHLFKGEAGEARKIEQIDDVEDAFGWLQAEIPGYDNDPSGQMNRVTEPEKLREEMSTGAHDLLIARLHEVVQLSAEGHHGLKIAINRVRQAFLTEVLGGAESEEARRDISAAQAEWRRALCGEVSKLRDDIANDLIRISPVGGYTAEDGNIDLDLFREKMLRQWVERRNTIVDAEEYDDNDSGRARMFLDALGDSIRPIRSGTDDWAWWDESIGRLVKLSKSETYGLLWNQSVVASLQATANRLFRQAEILEEQGSAEAEDTEKLAKAYSKRAITAGNRTIIEHSMSMAHVLSGNAIDPAAFDTNPTTWGVGNGVLDLTAAAKNGGVDVDYDSLCRKGRPEDLILQHTPIPYEPNFTHPKWESYLNTFLPDADYRRYVRKVFGYAFLGGNPQRRIVFIQGGTSTGKTTILESVQACLGDYGAVIDMNGLFRQKRDSGPMPEILSALPRRVVFASEIGQRNRLHADVIKRLTGGDSVIARALYSNVMVQRTPMFTPIVATNSMPTIEDGDAALWRRLLVLPFDRQVPPSTVETEPIKNNPEALKAVLSWLVDGLLDYLMEGLDVNMPPSVKKRQRTFIAGTSTFQMFLDEMVEDDENGRVQTPVLFELYRQWAAREEIRDVLSKRDFFGRMRDNGYESKKASVRRDGKVTSTLIYKGIRVAKD
ncbi:DNA primase/polymerase/helicase [Gordonia phage Marietta]|uniref:DNA primase/polymerase/helicase n=1 Tax=Gordonia phage Marietta TaxID=2301558 RepID=A0A385DPL1_9CAUD|nr:DNA primase [Gordonia phage Marietta]AXQ61373.1 DNA primase/polymerase/helicase [Gordonia phage Marietta]QAU06379.1 DNA primase/polymerase/helicase [Gordonia phage WhoseManz]